MQWHDVRDYRLLKALRVGVEDGIVREVKPLAVRHDEALPLVAPSLCDVQINGYAGIDLNDETLSREAWQTAVEALRRDGCGEFCVALITCEIRLLKERLRRVVELGAQTPEFLGVHLEGPFLNPSEGTRGVHPPEAMRKISESFFDELGEELLSWVRVLTLAPECGEEETVARFIRQCVRRGIRVAGGHSAIDSRRLRWAIDAGLSGWTHLGNGMPAMGHKFDHVFWQVLAVPGLVVSLIPDGMHLPVAVFRGLALALGERMILTTDAMAGAGAPSKAEVRLSGRLAQLQTGMVRGKNDFAKLPTEDWTRWAPWARMLDVEAFTRHRQWVPSVGAMIPRAVDGEGRLAGSCLKPIDAIRQAAWMLGVPWTVVWDAYSVRVRRWLLDNDEDWLRVGSRLKVCKLNGEGEGSILSVAV
jgi:N-acetylglucosamine-6-phosphate deacetylase